MCCESGRAVFDRELRDDVARRDPWPDVVPAKREVLVRQNRAAARFHVGRARAPLLFQLPSALVDIVRLDDDERRAGVSHVVANRRGSIERGGIVGLIIRRQELAKRRDGHLIDGFLRPLRGGVVPADRLDDVADELEPDRLRLGRRKEVDDAAADAELAVLVDRVAWREPGVGQALAEVVRRDLHPGSDGEAGRGEPRRRAQARQQRPRGRDDDARLARREQVQGPRARGRHLEVQRQAAVRIDFLRRKRRHRALEVGRRQPLEHAKKKARVGRELLDDGVGGRDGDHAAGLRGEMKGGRGRTEPRQTAGRPGEPGSRGGQLQQGSESERRRRADQTSMIPSYAGRLATSVSRPGQELHSPRDLNVAQIARQVPIARNSHDLHRHGVRNTTTMLRCGPCRLCGRG